ncbi:MAG: hypothetical protein F4034_07095 [Chloroflexi bacterium]|nr:hypothetical protein [Chloroflexota bacterium]MYK61723.1 hypothetical protein [Chloroflexota bacterium]
MIRQHMHFKTVGYMSTSDWLAAAGVVVSTSALLGVGFGAVWLQHRLENLRLKREVFRRVVGNVHGIIHDCQVFKDSHSFNEAGLIAINEVRATYSENDVLIAWSNWHASDDPIDFAELIRAMSAACKLKQYQNMDPREVADAFKCSCVPDVV